MPDASETLPSYCSLGNFQVVYQVKLKTEGFYSFLHIVAQLFAILNITDIDNFWHRIAKDHVILHDFLEHRDIPIDEFVHRRGFYVVVVVIFSNKYEKSIGSIMILEGVAAVLGVIAQASEEGRHLGPRDADHVANHSFPRNRLQSVFCIEHAGKMDCPALPAILDLLHVEEANGVPSTHHPVSRCDAIAQEVQFIVIALTALCQRAAFYLNPIKYAVLAGSVRPVMVLCYLNYLKAVRLRIFCLEYSDFLIFFGVNCLCRVSVQHNMINVPRIDHIPYNFGGFLEAKVDLKAGPIINNTSTLHVISTMQRNLFRQWGIGSKFRAQAFEQAYRYNYAQNF